MLSVNNLIKILSFEIFLFSCGKGENLLEISLPNDYNKFEPPVSPNENDQDFGPLKVKVLFQSIMINEIDQEHQTIIADVDIVSSWVENRLIVSGNTSGFDHKVKFYNTDSLNIEIDLLHFRNILFIYVIYRDKQFLCHQTNFGDQILDILQSLVNMT